MDSDIKIIYEKPAFYIRIESRLGYYAFYTVDVAPNKTDASIMARKQFAKDFGGTFENCSVGYIWDDTALINVNIGKKISKEIQCEVLYD